MQITHKLVTISVGTLLISNSAFAQTAVTNVELEDGLLSSIQEAHPESRNVNSDFLNPDYDPYINFADDAQVGITFIDEGAGYRNSFGYFTFENSTFDGLSFGDIDTDGSGVITIGELGSLGSVETGMIFDNASKLGAGGSLRAGDTVVLGGGSLTADGTDFTMQDGEVFSSGTNMGFFLLQNAYSGWRGVNENATAMYSIDFLNPENVATATYDDVAGDSRHVAMMFTDFGQDELILGFEDLNRNGHSDDDFNDAVFRIRTDPVTALAETNVTIMTAPAPHLGSGLVGLIGLGTLLLFGRNRKEKQFRFSFIST